MSSSSFPPEGQQQVQSAAKAEERKGDIPLEEVAVRGSLGERVLPYLYMAMESCWIYAIFLILPRTNIFHSSGPLLPLWGPFVLFAGSYFFTRRIERRQFRRALAASGGQETRAETRGSVWVFVLVGLLTLLVSWGALYAGRYAFYDPGWLGALLVDLGRLTPGAFQLLAIWGAAIYFCWRGMNLSRIPIEPGAVMRRLRIGIVVILLALILSEPTGGQNAGIVLIPLFLALSLLTHALAQAIDKRNTHAIGLQGEAIAQERALFLLVGGVAVVLLLLAFMLGSLISPSLLRAFQQALAPLGAAYDGLANILAWLVIIVGAPIVWLLSLLYFVPAATSSEPQNQPQSPVAAIKPRAEQMAGLVMVLKILLPLVFIMAVALLIFWFVRKRRKVALRRRAEELHESLWSWTLFRAQVMAFLLGLWRRIFARKAKPVEEQEVEEPVQGAPALRSVREIYRAFLKWAAQRGIARKRYETPAEFQRRVLEKYPQNGREVQTLTSAYASIRYGGFVPAEQDVQAIKKDWQELSQQPHSTL